MTNTVEESSDGLTPEELALIDDLTKLPNRRALYLRFVQEIRRTQRHHDSIALLMIDVDHLKQVNDKYGHLNGDAVLAELAGMLVKGLSEWDVAARYGEDEFALILRETKAGALTLADGIRARVAATTFPGGLKLTISVGVVATDKAVLFTDFIARAERALSTAKRRGGDQVVGDIRSTTKLPPAASSEIESATRPARTANSDQSVAGGTAGMASKVNAPAPDVGVQGWMFGVGCLATLAAMAGLILLASSMGVSVGGRAVGAVFLAIFFGVTAYLARRRK